MGKSIVDIKNMGDALRNTGYKNIESAISEIVDNSVEAQAKNIFIILSESINIVSGRKIVTEIGFLDNGEGMNSDILGSCLGIGSTTRQARRGMGRFGVGLPQASLYACPEVIVYSWQKGIENCRKVYLDIDKVKEGIQTEIEDPVLEDIPDKYKAYIEYKTLTDNYDFSKHGTLVIWKNCDRISPKTRTALTERLEFSLGQKFRYFIHKKISQIKIVCDENQDIAVDVFPNDPLFLMEDNYILCDPEEPKKVYKKKRSAELEPVFELYTGNGIGTGEVRQSIKYYDKNGQVATANVIIRFSIVKAKFYDETAFPTGNPGSYAFGKIAKKMEGISVVRANREIDFRRFDFYDTTNEPQHRWWGCEIIFDPELDEAFGVANNKQYVELKRIEAEDIDPEEEVQPLWNQLYEIVHSTITEMYAKNEVTRKNTRSFDDVENPSTEIINIVENDDLEDDEEENNEDPFENIPEDEKIAKGKEELENQGYENPTDEQASRFINNSINYVYGDMGLRSPAFDYKNVFNTTVITINTSHAFYTSFLRDFSVDAKTTFELFLGSLIQSIRKTDTYQKVENDRLISTWYHRLDKYIMEQLNPRDTK